MNNNKETMWVHPSFKRLIKGYAYSKGDKMIPLTERLAKSASKDFDELRTYRDKIKKQ